MSARRAADVYQTNIAIVSGSFTANELRTVNDRRETRGLEARDFARGVSVYASAMRAAARYATPAHGFSHDRIDTTV